MNYFVQTKFEKLTSLDVTCESLPHNKILCNQSQRYIPANPESQKRGTKSSKIKINRNSYEFAINYYRQICRKTRTNGSK